MSANLENSAVATELEKVSFHRSPKERQCQCSNFQTIVLISHASKVMLKILEVRLQKYGTNNFQMYKLGLEKAKEPEIKLPTFIRSYRKQEDSRKTFTSASLTTWRSLIVWITTNKILKEMGKSDHLTWFLRNLYAGQEATLYGTTDWFKIGKGVRQAVYYHLYLTSMQNRSYSHTLWNSRLDESWLPGERSTTSDMQMIPF